MNKDLVTIKELKDELQWKRAFPVVNQLRTNLNEFQYIELLKKYCPDKKIIDLIAEL